MPGPRRRAERHRRPFAVDGPPAQILTEEIISRFAGARVSVVEGPDGEIVVVPKRR